MLTDQSHGVRLTRERFLDLLNVEKFCPVNPAIAIQAMMLAEDVQSNFAAIARVVESDAALAGRLLGTANIVAKRGGPIQTLDRAIGAMGIRATRSLLVGCALIGHLSRDGLSGLNWRRFWQFQLCSAVAARRIGGDQGAETFAAALMQNIGILALARIGGPPQIMEVNRDPGGMDSLISAELQRFGVTHGQAGAWLLSTWGVSGPLTAQAADHVPSHSTTDDDSPSKKPPHPGLLAEWIAAVATGFGAAPATKRLAQWLPNRLHMRFADLGGLIKDVHHEAEQLAQALRVEIVRFDDADVLFEQAAQFLAESTFHLFGQLRVEAPSRATRRSRRMFAAESKDAASVPTNAGDDREPMIGVLTSAAFEQLIATRCRRAGLAIDGETKAPASALVGLLHLRGFNDVLAREGNAIGAQLQRAVAKSITQNGATTAHEREAICTLATYGGGLLAITADIMDAPTALEFAQHIHSSLLEDQTFSRLCDESDIQTRLVGVFVDDWRDLDAATILGLCDNLLDPDDVDAADVQVQPLALAAMRVLVAG